MLSVPHSSFVFRNKQLINNIIHMKNALKEVADTAYSMNCGKLYYIRFLMAPAD